MSTKKPMLNRQQVYKKVFDERFFRLLVINRLPRDYSTRRANIYAVKNTERVYQELRAEHSR